jgi:peptidoglycan/LPS O-acetylase OafA/YrhL
MAYLWNLSTVYENTNGRVSRPGGGGRTWFCSKLEALQIHMISSPLSAAVSAKEIPSLNGIRAIASFAVMFYHLGWRWSDGPFAVVCFFVLSGFLITHLLLGEYGRTGTVSIKSFYVRRSLRILPACYGYLACWGALRILAGRGIDWGQFLSAALYVRNYYEAIMMPAHPALVHTW